MLLAVQNTILTTPFSGQVQEKQKEPDQAAVQPVWHEGQAADQHGRPTGLREDGDDLAVRRDRGPEHHLLPSDQPFGAGVAPPGKHLALHQHSQGCVDRIARGELINFLPTHSVEANL